MNLSQPSIRPDVRERLIQAGYELLTKHGITGSGVDHIVERADCAKATLYKIFGSKMALTLAVLQRREDLWTRGWLEKGLKSHATGPEDRLLAIFDLFHEWFQQDDFEGCTFMKVLLEPTIAPQIRKATLAHSANIRLIVRELAEDAGLDDVKRFTDAWMIIMDGSILAACQGNTEAARIAKQMAEPVLRGWPRQL